MKEKNREPFVVALRISTIFLLISVIAIYLSDKLLLTIYINNLNTYNKIRYFRPYALVLFSSIVILFLVHNHFSKIKKYKITINSNLKEIHHKEIDLYQAECRINNQKALISSIIKSASLLILTLDENFKIKKADGNLNLFTSLSEENLIGEKLDLLFESPLDIEDILNNPLRSSDLKLVSNHDGEKYVLLDIKLKNKDLKNKIEYTAVLIDITQRKTLENQVHYLDYYDSLTDLPNRILLEIKYKNIRNNSGFENNHLAFLYIDIDDFKHINESFGHQVGDKFLVYMSRLLKNSISENDIIARITQDEFAIISPNICSKDDVEKLIKNIYNNIKQSWKFKDHEYNSSVTIGVSIAPYDGYDFDVLLKNAHIACEYLKSHDKGRHQYYSKNLGNRVLYNSKIVNELKSAITKEEFVLYYQTVVDLKTFEIIGVEALVRWIHPKRGIIPPMAFIPIAEKTSLTYELMNLIVKKALNQKREWKAAGVNIPQISINISSKSFSQRDFDLYIEQSIEEYGLENKEIILELTESGFTENIKAIENNMNYLRSIGIEIAMDDFGTGYSTLARLKEIPIDYLKLDKSFIDKMTKDSEDEIMVKSVISLAKTFGIKVLAEGIETEEQYKLLQDMGCDLGQGYYMSKPVPSEDLYIP